VELKEESRVLKEQKGRGRKKMDLKKEDWQTS